MLDKLDRAILVELDKNSRQSFSKIAQRVKTSKNVVSYRINQLISKNIINGFYAVIDTVKLGYYNHRVYLKLKNCNEKQRSEIVRAFVNDPGTWWVAKTSYPWDIAIIILARNMHEANARYIAVAGKFQQYISKYQLNSYIQLIHFPKDYLVDQPWTGERQSFVLGEETATKITEMEYRILRILSTNARIGTIALAKKLKTTPMVVKYAIKKLIKQGVIGGFRVLLDYEKIGYEYYWIHMNVSANSNEIKKFVSSFRNTAYTDETLGGDTIEFAVHIKKEESIQGIIDILLEQFGEFVSDYYYFRVIKNEKVIYMPHK